MSSSIARVNVTMRGVEVSVLGDIDELPEPIKDGSYACLGDLPGWAQERIAVLMLTDPKNVDIVRGIGLRVNDNTFWLHD